MLPADSRRLVLIARVTVGTLPAGSDLANRSVSRESSPSCRAAAQLRDISGECLCRELERFGEGQVGRPARLDLITGPAELNSVTSRLDYVARAVGDLSRADEAPA